MKPRSPSPFLAILLLTVLTPAIVMAAPPKMPNPDFTKGEEIPAGATKDWNLGATGARGWMYTESLETSKARQIRVTKVDKGTPAESVLQVGDVILGVAGKPFSYDARTEFGKALTQAESDAGAGKLIVSRWRAGQAEDVTIQLPVLGTYSATAPYNCPKSKRILEQGCKALALRIADPKYNENPVSRSLNGLALLASGNAEYMPLIKKEADWAASYTTGGYQTWYYGYVISFLAEYVIATADQSVVPGLRRLAMEAATGQSAVGSWGHRFANPDGRLGGYGMMNAPGVPLTISLVLARKAGLKEPEIAQAIDRSSKLLRFYIGKGAIPYGDHAPWVQNHEDNGKCGMGAVLFNLLEEDKGTTYFSRMSLASHGNERDTGHTGNFWNLTWAMPAVALSGPNASGAWMKEYGAWHYDLTRRADGNFTHPGPAQSTPDSTNGWDATGAYLLGYAMPLRKIYLNGKLQPSTPQLNPQQAEEILALGRGWSNSNRFGSYDSYDDAALLKAIGSWSPIVRERAAISLARRPNLSIDTIIEKLRAPEMEAKLGACLTIVQLKAKAAAAVPALRELLKSDDYWLRVNAASALAAIGPEGRVAAPELLTLMAKKPGASDPRGMEQRYLCNIMFARNGMLGQSIEGIDRNLLFTAMRAGLQNQDGHARGAIAAVYDKLSPEELTTLMPDIHRAVVEPSPSGEMFADGIRKASLEVLAKNRIAEGMQACIDYIVGQNGWASEKRTAELLKILKMYGAHAQPLIPKLEAIAADMDDGETNFPAHLSKQKAADVRKAIEEIKAMTEKPELKPLP
ncbi:MAG TPA: DUF6288 domain-containing protein [Luteolibacter sp.]|nr:DUF6288 domain-containing protein [Luteolibacter sp.]